jgi:hypothetical protein
MLRLVIGFLPWIILGVLGNRSFVLALVLSLDSPLLFSHWPVADDVLADRVLDLLCVTPAFRIAVLQPDKRSADVGRAMLDVVNDDRLFAPATRRTI